jgi:hypothetical protein
MAAACRRSITTRWAAARRSATRSFAKLRGRRHASCDVESFAVKVLPPDSRQIRIARHALRVKRACSRR